MSDTFLIGKRKINLHFCRLKVLVLLLQCPFIAVLPDMNSKVMVAKSDYDTTVPLLSIYTRDIKACVHKLTCKRMFITALFIITKNSKEPQCPLTGEWVNTAWFIQAMECHWALTKNEVLIHVPIWINLSNIMFSERGQTEESANCVITFILSARRNTTNLWW